MNKSDLQGRLLFGIPKKGRLHDKVLELLIGSDIQFTRKPRLDIALSTNHPIAIIFLPAKDIAQFVGEGEVDIGITGADMIDESNVKVDTLLNLGFGKCKLCLQIPQDSAISNVSELSGMRIVTSFPNISNRFFSSNNVNASIKYVSGSVEAACALGLADAVVDLVESGDTMLAAKLKILKVIMETEAILISNSRKHSHNPLIEKIKKRIQGVIVAQRYVLCTYNIKREFVNAAVKVTPGKKAPTLSSLEIEDWVSVSVMVKKSEVSDIMDELEAIGAEDILITEIRNTRMG